MSTSGDVNLVNAINNVANSILLDTAGIVRARTAIAQQKAEADFSMMNAQFMERVADGKIAPENFAQEWDNFKGQYDDYVNNVSFKPAQEAIRSYAAKVEANIYLQAAQANNQLQLKLGNIEITNGLNTIANDPSLNAQQRYENSKRLLDTGYQSGMMSIVDYKQKSIDNNNSYNYNSTVETAKMAGSISGAMAVINGVSAPEDDGKPKLDIDIGSGQKVQLPESMLTDEESIAVAGGNVPKSVIDKAKQYADSPEYMQNQEQSRMSRLSQKIFDMPQDVRFNALAAFQKELDANDKTFGTNYDNMLKNNDGVFIDTANATANINSSDISQKAKDSAIGKLNDHNLLALDRYYSGAINSNIDSKKALEAIKADIEEPGRFTTVKAEGKFDQWGGYEGSKSGEDVRWELLQRINERIKQIDANNDRFRFGSGEGNSADSPFSIPRQNGVFNNWTNGLTITGEVPDANKGEKPASIADTVEYFNNASQSKNPTEARYGMDMKKKVLEYIPTQAKSSWDSLNNEVFRKDKNGQYIHSLEDRSFVMNQFMNAIHNNPTWGNKEVSSFTTNLLATIMDKRQDLRGLRAGIGRSSSDVYIGIIKRAQNKEFQYSINFNPDHSDNSSPRVINQYKDALSYVVNDLRDNYGIDATPVYFENGQFQMKMNDKNRTTIHVSVNKDNKLVYSYDNKKVISPKPVGGKAVRPETFSKETDSEFVKNIQRAFGFTTGAHK